MGLLDLFGKSDKGRGPQFKAVQKLPWARSVKGGFQKLLFIDPDDEKIQGGGIVVVWHGGIRPAWVYVADVTNVGQEIGDILNNKEIMSYENRGGLYVTWVNIQAEFRPGVVRYLIDKMHPVVDNPSEPPSDVEPIAVYFPGKEDT